MDQLTDIVRAAKDGDREAFDAIVHRFQDMAYGRAFAWIGDHGRAEDAAQEAFVDAYLHLDQLREPAAFPGWFGRIVVKHSDRQRRSTRPSVSLEDAPNLMSNEPDPLDVVQGNEMAQAIQEKIATLSEEHREAITLFHLEDYTQQEVAAFLDVPVSTIKKRLFDARKTLKKRMRTMAPTQTSEKRPSQDDDFKRRVQFFIAIRTRDFDTLDDLIRQDRALFEAKTDLDVAPELFWSRDITAVFWAVQTGDEELLAFLLERGANVDVTARSADTPLHHAVMMGEHELAKLLIDKGANLEAVANRDQTVLHRASLAGDTRLVEFLVESGADLEAKDAQGRTAADWAAMKSRRAILDLLLKKGAREPTVDFAEGGSYLIAESRQRGLIGRIIDADGNPVDGRGPIEDPTILRAEKNSSDRPGVLETGIKPLDLFAPIKRGSTVGKELCLHVGGMLLYGQIIHNLVTRDNVRVVYILAPEGSPFLGSREFWYGTGNAFRNGVVLVVADPNDTVDRLRATVEKGFLVANDFRGAGYDVLVQLQGRLYPNADFTQLNRGTDAKGSITTMIHGDPPNGISDVEEDFDSVIYMSPHLASVGLYPAVDWELSRSDLLEDGTFDVSHVETVREVRQRLYEYNHFNLHAARKKQGEHFLYMDDGGVTVERMKRTRRLSLFLTQSYHGTEMWTGQLGATVPLSHTVVTCQRILDGEYDDVPEKAWYAMGRMEGILERSKREDVKKEDVKKED